MNVRGLAVLAGLVALGGWLASGSGVWRGPSVAPAARHGDDPPPPIALEAAGVRAGVQRLQARPGDRPALPPATRNPFRFHERQPAPEPVPAEAASRSALSTANVSIPDFRLVGMAEDPGPDGPQRTAVVSGFDQLFFLKAGDQFAGHFKVLTVSADTVQVEDSTNGRIVTLILR
ncbi:MAG: hypothetical protein EHM24_13255 [Acidobacteria bacterium]|nr:MAG: hypothetical protein EHM24_13255 [Acidobacteriota bacterium]